MTKKKYVKPFLKHDSKFRSNEVKYEQDLGAVYKCMPKMVGRNLVVGKHVINTRDF